MQRLAGTLGPKPASGHQPPGAAAPRSQRLMPRSWTMAVIAMVAVFYVANVYDYALSGQLFYVKWLTVLPVMALSWNVAQRRDLVAGVPSSPMPLVFIGFATLLSVLVAPSIEQSGTIYVSLVLGLVTAYALAHAIIRTGGERQFFDAIAFVGRLVIVSAAVMYLLGLSLGRGHGRFTAWADNPNTLALLLAPSLVILMADALSRRRGWLWWSLPFLAAGGFLLMTTGSRASALWVMAAGLGFYTFRRGIGLSLLIGVLGLLLAVQFWSEIVTIVFGFFRREEAAATADVLSGRSEIWPLGLRLFGEQPLIGHGLGTSQTLLASYEWMFIESQGLHFHNSYLTVAVETGIVGLSALAAALIAAVAGGARRSHQARTEAPADWPLHALPWAMFVGALAHAFFESWLFSAGNANMILVWTCILLLMGREVRVRSAN